MNALTTPITGKPAVGRIRLSVMIDPDILDGVERTPYGTRSEKINRLLRSALAQAANAA